MKTRLRFADLPKTYDGLLRMHMLRPLRDRVDLTNAHEILEAMAGHNLNREQEDYFEALSILTQAYERSFVPPPRRRVSGLELLRHLLEANKLSAADLARMLGRERSLGVRILNGERSLTLDHLIKVSEYFRLPLEAFLP